MIIIDNIPSIIVMWFEGDNLSLDYYILKDV